MTAYAVIRIRGHAKIRRNQVDTMEIMRLTRPNHCVLVRQDDTSKGMLQMVKDYVTWGEVSHETIARLLHQRGEIVGGEKLTDTYVKENSKYASILSLAKAIEKGEADMGDVKGLKQLLRLPPPRQGYEGIKRSWNDGGALGYRGADVEKLIDKMLAKPKEAK
jgi:large subunit ribosomal protein L30